MKRILLIEDDLGAQILSKNRLEDLGYEVAVASTGAMGLMEARSSTYDLFLVDIGLGSGIDGFEVCRRLKSVPEIHGVPVVLISGHVKTQEELHRGYEAGCQSFLVKGDLVLLEDVVRANLRSKSLLDELAIQNRLLDEKNRHLETERTRNADLTEALSSQGGRQGALPLAVMLVDEEGVVQSADRHAREVFGQSVEGKHLARLAPDSRLEAAVRNVRSEPADSIRFEVPGRSGRPTRTLVASIRPLVPASEDAPSALRTVLLFDPAHVRSAAAEGQGAAQAARPTAALVEAARVVYRPGAMAGTSVAARELRTRLRAEARGAGSLLLQGPSGVGKQFAARILHFTGQRAGPFVSVPCGASNSTELEHELFGVPDSPPGSVEAGGALFQARGGTVFLQDLDRMPPAVQERLLELLERERERFVTSGAEHVEPRVLAGMRTELDEAVERGRLREDLAEWFSARRVVLPALARRPEDVVPLARGLLERHAHFEDSSFAPEVEQVLQAYRWPDNVRELELVVQRACDGAHSPTIGLDQLPAGFGELLVGGLRSAPPAPLRRESAARASFEKDLAELGSPETPVSLERYERCGLLHALAAAGGDKLRAARLLQIGKSTFYRKLKNHGIT